jgi:hypothetical protein
MVSMLTLRSLLSSCALALVPLATGCNHSVFSPPARAVPLESAATLPRGDTGVALEGAHSGTIFGPEVLSGAARIRHGVSEGLDVSAEATLMRLSGTPAPAADVSRNVYAGRIGAMGQLVSPESPWAPTVAVTGGLGGGVSAAGGYVSPDAGPIVAWENRWAVPFLSLRGGVSQPVGARSVDTSSVDDGPGRYVDTPRTTWIAAATAGVRVPIGWAEPEAGKTRGSLLAGLGFTHLADTRDDETFAHLALGGEVVF